MEAYMAKESDPPPNPTTWMKRVELINFVWENNYIPMELG